ncbi:CTX-M-66 [Klebsiella pneumoniae]|nr:CTX-M-66 [Klebsiella pneumoniae]CAH5082698.1 CTX-M-66 [Klebsiella pneumoniae]
MVKKSLRQFTLMATATVTLLLGFLCYRRHLPALAADSG